MGIDPQRLRSLVVLAEELHFGRAAARLHITQPSLSQQVARLEREVGVRLVDRGPRGTRLTGAGARLADAARPALEAIDRAVAEIREAEGIAPTLRIGVPRMEYTGHPAIAALAERARAAAGAERVEFAVLLAGPALAALRAGEVDAAYMYAPVDDDSVEVVPAFTDTLVMAMAGGHPLAGRDRLVFADLAGQTIVTWSRRSMPELRATLDMYCEKEGFSPVVAEAPDTPGALGAMVARTGGVALVAQAWAEMAPESGLVFRAIARPQMVIACVLAWPRDRPGRGSAAIADAATLG
ncbi:MAG: LysR family transcriptional regulator [Thermoleophilia bacterium]|nr:LysR family transcriptional regulator [Thermoleophilia bacterium]